MNAPAELLDVLETYPALRLCLVFRSTASGKATPQSDLDLAVAADRPLTAEEQLDIMEAVSAATSRAVDLIDLTTQSGPILKQALSKGTILRNADKLLYARLITRMLFEEADMMPYYRRILAERRERYLNG